MNHALFAAHRLAREEFLPFQTVLGVGVGPKVTRGKVTAQEAIVVLVERKLRRREVPKGKLIPSSVAGFPTDVREPVLMVAPDQGRKSREQRHLQDWCRTDAQWIDWAKIHDLNVMRQVKPRASESAKHGSGRASSDN